MCAKTSVVANPNLKKNKFWLNGIEQTFDNERLQNCLKECKFTINKYYSKFKKKSMFQ